MLRGDIRHRANQSGRVKPVIEAATPKNNFVVLADSLDYTAEGFYAFYRFIGGKTEWNNRDQLLKVRIIPVCLRGDAPQGHQLAEVEMLLTLCRTQEEIAPQELSLHRRRCSRDERRPLPLIQVSGLLELLEVHRVIDVDDQNLLRCLQSVEQLQSVALKDDDIGPLLPLFEFLFITWSDLSEFETIRYDLGELRERHQGRIVLLGELRSNVPCPDSRPG